MYREIPPKQINKAKRLLKAGHSMRNVEFMTGISFFTVRKIYHEMQGTDFRTWEKRDDDIFHVEGRCWLTGITLELERVRK